MTISGIGCSDNWRVCLAPEPLLSNPAMPYEISVDPETGVVRIAMRGDVNESDLLEAIINARDVSAKRTLQLWDARDVMKVKIEPDVLDSLHDLAKLRTDHGVDIRGKRALLAQSEDIRFVVELLAGEFQELGVEIRFFPDEPRAMDWLLE